MLSLLCFVLLAAAPPVEAGTIEVEGGVNQDVYDQDHPGYRCENKTPLFFSIQGPALVYAEIWGDSGLKGRKPTFYMWKNHKLMDLSPLEPFEPSQKPKKPGALTSFAMDVGAGPNRYTLKCPKGPVFLVKLWSVEKVPKKIPFAIEAVR